jgi:RNA polymerase sigma-70 factor (ECF subfamily)
MDGETDLREEQRLIALILGGDSRLFHDLIRPYERSVYIMALSLLHNEGDAEDAAQEAFLKAFRNLACFRGDAKFGTWLISITLNEARSRIRRKSAFKIESLDVSSDEAGHVSPALLTDWKEVPSEALERSEVRLLLQEAIAALPPIYREVFLLRDVEELSTAEAAEPLKVSVASIKVRLHRARLMLQKILAPQLTQMNPQVNSRKRWFQWS